MKSWQTVRVEQPSEPEVVIGLVSTVGVVTLVLPSVRLVLVEDGVTIVVEPHVLLGHSEVLQRGKQVENGTPHSSTPSTQTVGHEEVEGRRLVLLLIVDRVVVAITERLHRGGRGGGCVHAS